MGVGRSSHNRADRPLALESIHSVRPEIDIRGPPGNQVRDQSAGLRGAGETDVLMTEGVENSPVALRVPNHGHAVRQRWPLTHPLAEVVVIHIGKQLPCLSSQQLGAPVVRRSVEARELRRAGESQTSVHGGGEKFLLCRADNGPQLNAWLAQHNVIATFGLQRHLLATSRSQFSRPGSRRDDEIFADDIAVIRG